MVVLGLIFIVLGILALVAGVFLNDGSATIIGIDVTSVTIFVVGALAGASLLWGYSILKWGTKRGLAQRKERRELTKMADKLDRVEAERRAERGETPPTV